jgi:hypothetical protein
LDLKPPVWTYENIDEKRSGGGSKEQTEMTKVLEEEERRNGKGTFLIGDDNSAK